MPHTKMDTVDIRCDIMDSKLTRQLHPARINYSYPMRFIISKNTATPTTSWKQSLIEDREALATTNSSQSNSSPVAILRSVSSLSERQANELLLDNSDRISEMMRKGKSATYDDCADYDIDYDSDCDSDLEI
ncbi:unnamed protein product [Cylindrotheca closterium]|uniref:Uncharacterized protein n=1 Tax=Cylindrotheca closterium TaxID=2856 RepID=A0AAD2FKT2_9STRA|nr:unnamed protein product [Cylindrotheca closterium]